MTPAEKNLWDLNERALKQCSIEKDWYGKKHGPHADGHDCGAIDTPVNISMTPGGGIDHVTCALCGFLLQVG